MAIKIIKNRFQNYCNVTDVIHTHDPVKGNESIKRTTNWSSLGELYCFTGLYTSIFRCPSMLLGQAWKFKFKQITDKGIP